MTHPGVEPLYEGLKAGGANFAVYLPDSVLIHVVPKLQADPGIPTFACAREDEGVAMAAGAWLGGKLPVALMEGSGVGYAGLALARAKLQRTPLLLLASHTLALGEPYDYHGASALSAEGVVRGLDIPHVFIHDTAQIRSAVEQALVTVRGQKSIVALLFASYTISGSAK